MIEDLQPKDGDKHLTKQELKALFASIKHPRDRAIFVVAYFRGLRASEIGMLPITAYDRANGTLFVKRLKRSMSGKFLLSPVELRAVNAWVKIRGPKAGAMFPSNRGKGISRQQIYVLTRKYCAAAGIPKHKSHPHVLKHSIATHLHEKGVDVLKIQKWLGHKSINSTLEYTHVLDHGVMELAEALYVDW